MNRFAIKILLSIASVVTTTTWIYAQQYTPRTHFYENRLAYNPASAGVEEEIPIRLNFRQQWQGLKDAPYTQTLSSQAFAGRHIGLGLVLYNDVGGPARNTGLQASVARHFALDSEGRRWLSFGMSLLLYQFKFDVSSLRTDKPNDPAVYALSRQNSRLVPDAATGVYINDDNGFVGISVLNLIESRSDIFTAPENPNTVGRTYYLIAGYRFPLTERFSIEPVALAKLTDSKTWQADAMIKANFDQYWGGFSYRTNDAASILLGLRIDMFSFAYSYDYPLNDLGVFNTGTHEVTVAVHIFNAQSRTGASAARGGPVRRVKGTGYNPRRWQ
jgi:type IX secretion system PorP/SprF family membrane protein